MCCRCSPTDGSAGRWSGRYRKNGWRPGSDCSICCPRSKVADLLARLDAADTLLKEAQRGEGDLLPELLDLAEYWYRDLLVWKQLAQPALLTNRDRQDQIERLASAYTDAALGARIAAIEEAKDALKRNGNPRLVLEKLFLSFGARRPPQTAIGQRADYRVSRPALEPGVLAIPSPRPVPSTSAAP